MGDHHIIDTNAIGSQTDATTDIRRLLLGLTLEGLQTVAADCGMPKFAAKQMANWLYVK